MDSDEEERLQRWKEHLASQANNDDDDGLMPPPEEGSEDEREDDADASVNSGRGGGGSSSRGKAQAGWYGASPILVTIVLRRVRGYGMLVGPIPRGPHGPTSRAIWKEGGREKPPSFLARRPLRAIALAQVDAISCTL
jgi:hypothetical protein